MPSRRTVEVGVRGEPVEIDLHVEMPGVCKDCTVLHLREVAFRYDASVPVVVTKRSPSGAAWSIVMTSNPSMCAWSAAGDRLGRR